MVQHRMLCFVIADGGRVRFVFPADDNALHTRDAPHSHEMEQQKFAHHVAKEVNDLSAAHGFDALVLVAPAHVLSEIQGHLDVTTTAKLIGTLAKDLTKVPDNALFTHLKDWVRPTHRVA